MAKVHLYSYKTLQFAPEYVRRNYSINGFRGARCGYVRKNVTTDLPKVTCKLCLKTIPNGK